MRSGPVALVLILVGILSCIDPFDPPEINSERTYLVYDGFIETGGEDTSWITLSKTQGLRDADFPPKVLGAAIVLENEAGQMFPIRESANRPGSYFLPPINLDLTPAYRIRITLADGKAYQSDWEYFRASPPIDSISYTIEGDEGVQFYVNTHDDSGQSRFYRWFFSETWEYFTFYNSKLELAKTKLGVDTIIEREIPINRCWRTLAPSHINISTTAMLTRDAVLQHPLHYVPISTNKLFWGYSMEVRQQVLSREAFEYWSELARNNETNGSLFDPFPSQLTGNIRGVDDPGDRVYGYFSGGTTHSVRKFYELGLGKWFICQEDSIMSFPALLASDYIPVDYFELFPPLFFTVNPVCADCRLGGGTLSRPDFWFKP